MADVFLAKEDWAALLAAATKARRGLRAFLSAEQAVRLTQDRRRSGHRPRMAP